MAIGDCYNACSNLQKIYKLKNIMQLNDSTDYAVRLMLWLSQDNQQNCQKYYSDKLLYICYYILFCGDHS